MFHFTKLEKLWAFFLKPDRSYPKITLTETTCVVSIIVTIMAVKMVIVSKGSGNVQWPKNLETVITEATFFSTWVYY